MTKKVTITIDDSVLEQIDTYADKVGLSRSSLIALSCSKYIDAEKKMPAMKELVDMFVHSTGEVLTGQITKDEYKDRLDQSQLVMDYLRK